VSPSPRNLRSAEHLPHLRSDGEPPHPSWLPRQRAGTSPQMVGRYPDYDVLANAKHWDAATRAVVEARLGKRQPMRFFAEPEQPTLRALCDVATAQDAEPRVPVAEMVDEKLAAGQLDGFRYADMPSDLDTWRLVLRGLDEAARARSSAESFAACTTEDREGIFAAFVDASIHGAAWDQLNVTRAFSVCMRAILAAFYSHPWAWNEIGYGGPAYPEGYMRMGPTSVLEPHERPGATSEDPVRQPDGS
jgi:Gluconate 2-dehydrogenase subunit 3